MAMAEIYMQNILFYVWNYRQQNKLCSKILMVLIAGLLNAQSRKSTEKIFFSLIFALVAVEQ